MNLKKIPLSIWLVNALLGAVCGFLLTGKLLSVDEKGTLLTLAMLISSFLGTGVAFIMAFNSLTFIPATPIKNYRLKTWFWTSIWYGISCSFLSIPIFWVLGSIIDDKFGGKSLAEGFAGGFMFTLIMSPAIIPLSFIITSFNSFWLHKKGLLTP